MGPVVRGKGAGPVPCWAHAGRAGSHNPLLTPATTCTTPSLGHGRYSGHAGGKRPHQDPPWHREGSGDRAGNNGEGSIDFCTSPWGTRDEVTVGCGRRRVVNPAAPLALNFPQSLMGCWLLHPSTSASTSQLPPLSWPQHMDKSPGAVPGASDMWAWHFSGWSRASKKLPAQV